MAAVKHLMQIHRVWRMENVQNGIYGDQQQKQLPGIVVIPCIFADNGRSTIVKVTQQDIEIDNRWIIPYSPILSKIFNAHINDAAANGPWTTGFLSFTFLKITKVMYVRFVAPVELSIQIERVCRTENI